MLHTVVVMSVEEQNGEFFTLARMCECIEKALRESNTHYTTINLNHANPAYCVPLEIADDEIYVIELCLDAGHSYHRTRSDQVVTWYKTLSGEKQKRVMLLVRPCEYREYDIARLMRLEGHRFYIVANDHRTVGLIYEVLFHRIVSDGVFNISSPTTG